MKDAETVFVLVTDEPYYEKAKTTIEDLRLCGEWDGDVVLVCVDFDPSSSKFVSTYDVECRHVKHIDVSCLTNAWATHPLKPTADNRHTLKLAQFNKLYVFDPWFRARWNRVVFIDAGMRIVDSVCHLLAVPWVGCFVAPDDSQPGDNGQRLRCQFDLEANPDVTAKLYADFGHEFFDEKYFMNCMWIYDTSLQDYVGLDKLTDGMASYPICSTNEMALMNLYFKKFWTPLPEKTADGSKYIYGWCELNYPQHERSWKNFCMLKYPTCVDGRHNIGKRWPKKNTIGVVVPCYIHHIKKLGALLDSIQRQTRLPDRVVVSCSSSKPEDIPYSASMYSFPLEIITCTDRLNAAHNRNLASKRIDTSIITYFDADDVMHPQRLEFIERVFNETNAVIILHNFIDGFSRFQAYDTSTIEYDYGKLRRAPSGCACHVDNMECRIHHSQSSIRAHIYDKVKFNESADHERREDAVFCGDILALYPTENAYIHPPLSLYFMEGVWH